MIAFVIDRLNMLNSIGTQLAHCRQKPVINDVPSAPMHALSSVIWSTPTLKCISTNFQHISLLRLIQKPKPKSCRVLTKFFQTTYIALDFLAYLDKSNILRTKILGQGCLHTLHIIYKVQPSFLMIVWLLDLFLHSLTMVSLHSLTMVSLHS